MPVYETQAFLITVCAMVGLCVGSFLNVVILRLPKQLEYRWRQGVAEELGADAPGGLLADDSNTNANTNAKSAPPNLGARSACPRCTQTLRWWQLLPVLSFILLRGRCGHCAEPIAVRYPLVELACAMAFAACAWRFGFDLSLPFALVITALLLTMAVIDADTQWLPDELTAPLAVIGMLAAYLGVFVSALPALQGALLGYLLPWALVRVHFYMTGRQGMGEGDIKLLGAAGFLLGAGVLSAILLGAVIGLVYAVIYLRRHHLGADSAVAFGPALCLAAWLTLIFNINFFVMVGA